VSIETGSLNAASGFGRSLAVFFYGGVDGILKMFEAKSDVDYIPIQ
jgi:hypothetical protein